MLNRRGVALVDLLVALTIFGILGALVVRTIVTSVRWTEAAVLGTERDAQLSAARESGELLLTAFARKGGDAVRLSDTAVVWWATVGAGPVCAVGGVSVLAANTRSDGVRLGGTSSSPQAGDVLQVFDDGPTVSSADDAWTRHIVQSARLIRGACGSSALLDPVNDAAFGAWELDVVPPLQPNQAGSPARLQRLSRMALYRSAGEWAVGVSELGPTGTWSIIQPVAGPLDPPVGGLRMEWLDSTLAPGATSPVAVRLRAAAPTRAAVRSFAGAAIRHDSVERLLAFRNRQ